jgi:DNA-binding NarL/FixJ family response regulator
MNTDPALRVVVGEDEPVFRAGLVHVLRAAGFDVVASAENADDLVDQVRAHLPDVVVVDIRMPPNFQDDGLKAAREIRTIDPPIAVLVLSHYLEDQYAMDLVGDRPEGVGYLLKDRLGDVGGFTDAVGRVARGGSVIDPAVVGLLVAYRRGPDPIDQLTRRERQVLGLMAEGRSNQGIAETLFVSVSGVERQVTSIFAKLGLPREAQDHRRVLAVLRYLRH